MKKLSQTLKIGLTLFVAVFSNGLLPSVAHAYSTTNPDGDYKKVYVCKYVGTPGANERLQTGNNPISVSTNALSNFTGLGSFFNDAQGRSVAIAWDNGDHIEPSVSSCPAPQGAIEFPLTLASNDPCNPEGVIDNVTWANPLPSDTDFIHWSETGNTRTATLKSDSYEWTDGTTAPKAYTLPADSGVLCSPEEKTPVAPQAPTVTDICGVNNDNVVAATTTGITYTVSHNGSIWTVTATANDGYTLDVTGTDYVLNEDGTATWTETLTDQPCKVIICHRTDSVKNPYVEITVSEQAVDGIAGNSGSEPDHFGEHQGPLASSEAVAQELKDQHLQWGDIIPPLAGIHDGLNWTTVGQAMLENGCNYVTEVTPTAPTPIDFCYSDRDGVWIPETDDVNGVTYLEGDTDVSGTFIPYEGKDITITAVAADKSFVIADGATTSWTFGADSFTNKQCLTITKTAKTATDTNLDGKIGVGDTVTWEITVTNTSSEDFNEAFVVDVDDPSATIENGGHIGFLAAGESVTLTATSTITTEQMLVCKVTNTATFSGWRAIDEEGPRLSILNNDEEQAPLATGSASADYTLDCTPGKGGETPTPTPTPTPELPHTGPTSSINYLLLGVITAVTIYGAIYFAQPKKLYE